MKFFDMKNLSVAVKYLGPAFASGERIEGRVKIGTSQKRTKEHFWTTIPEQALEFATVEPRYPDNISGNAKLISQWLLKENAFVPPHIHFTNKLEKHFCVLTRKANFLTIISDFKPFGIQLRELVNFHYFKTISRIHLHLVSLISKQFRILCLKRIESIFSFFRFKVGSV